MSRMARLLWWVMVKRAAFNRQIIEETGTLEMADISRDFKTATNGKGTYLIYFGKEINDTWRFNIPNKNANFDKPKKGNKYKVEIIDTWDMSVQKVETVFELSELNNYRFYDKNFGIVRLPLKPYLALRITEVK
jgi:predicted lipase